MASTTTYGDFPGVKVTTAGGAITGVAIGREEKLVIVGVGDPSTASASLNTATQVDSASQADNVFGDGSELAEAVKDALGNGANIDELYGVMLDRTSVSAETFSTTSSGTLADAPIYEDNESTGSGNEGSGTITVTDTTESASVTVFFRYDSPPTAPTDPNTIHINPITGEWAADESSDYEISYDYPVWTDGIDEAESIIETEESAIIAPLTESESLATDLSSRVNTLRGEYKMAKGVQTAEPNDNSDDDDADYDTAAYTDSIDNDAMFLHAPGRKEDSKYLITGALSGIMAGNALDDSIYNENLTVDNLDDRLSESEADDLRDVEVIPIKQPKSGGSITVEGNLSTSTETDWERNYHQRRIVDQVILLAKAVGDSIIGRINDERTRDLVQTQLEAELSGLADDRLIEANTEDEPNNWIVTVYEIDTNTIGIDLGITPTGIAKRIDTTITIST